MIFRDTSKNQIEIDKNTRFTLQKSSTGATVGKYAINEASFYTSQPNEFTFSTIPPSIPEEYKIDMNTEYPFLLPAILDTDKKTFAYIELQSSYSGLFHKFRAGDQLILKRHNIKRRFTISSVTKQSNGMAKINLLNDRSYQTDSFEELDNFVSEFGYGQTANGFLVGFERKLENYTDKSTLKDFYVDFNEYEYTDSCSIKVGWEVDPIIKAVKLRWRTIPRNNKTIETFSPFISSAGLYDFPAGITPNVTGVVVSATGDNGRSAAIQIEIGQTGPYYYMTDVIVNSEGGNYLTQPNIVIDNSYAITPGSVSFSSSTFKLQTEGRINMIQVLDGGSGYTGASVSVTPIVSGLTASGYAEINNGSITNIILTDPGYLFTSGPTSVSTCDIDITHGTGGTGAILRANIDIAPEWIYGDTLTDKTAIIHNIKRGIDYEIQIVCSNDELFRGENRYSNSINFIYY